MRRRFDRYRRPLLDVSRADTVAACEAEGIGFWADPHNADPAYTRARVRLRVLPVLEDELGPGVAETLARTADQLRRDMEALDRMADAAYADLREPNGLALDRLAGLDPAIASRVLRLAALEAGALAAETFHVHVEALTGLAAGHIDGEVQLPGGVSAFRGSGRLRFRRTAVES
jgi:tRNA(Ile)-lysidine synthase